MWGNRTVRVRMSENPTETWVSFCRNFFGMFPSVNLGWGSALDLDACVGNVFVLLANLSSIPPKMNASGLFLSHQLLKPGTVYISPTIWVPHLSVPGPCMWITTTSLSPLIYDHVGCFFMPYHARPFDLSVSPFCHFLLSFFFFCSFSPFERSLPLCLPAPAHKSFTLRPC